MILPTKHLSSERALISVASEVLELISNKSTVSSVWNDLQENHSVLLKYGDVPYDWYVLSLVLLYMMGLIDKDNGYLIRINNNDS